MSQCEKNPEELVTLPDATERHERLYSKGGQDSGGPGIRRLRSMVKDALHERMRQEIEARKRVEG